MNYTKGLTYIIKFGFIKSVVNGLFICYVLYSYNLLKFKTLFDALKDYFHKVPYFLGDNIQQCYGIWEILHLVEF